MPDWIRGEKGSKTLTLGNDTKMVEVFWERDDTLKDGESGNQGINIAEDEAVSDSTRGRGNWIRCSLEREVERI